MYLIYWKFELTTNRIEKRKLNKIKRIGIKVSHA